MNKLLILLLTLSLLVGGATAAQAQRGYRRGRGAAVPRAYGHRRPNYGPSSHYYHAAPYRSYGGRAYYRLRPAYSQPRYYRRPVYRRGPTVIIRH